MLKENVTLGELERFISLSSRSVDTIVGAAQIAFMVDEDIDVSNLDEFALTLQNCLERLEKNDYVQFLIQSDNYNFVLGSSVYMRRFKLKDNFSINGECYYFQPIIDYTLDFIPTEISELYALFFRKEGERVDDDFMKNIYSLRKEMFKDMEFEEILESLDIFRYTKFFQTITSFIHQIFYVDKNLKDEIIMRTNNSKKWKWF